MKKWLYFFFGLIFVFFLVNAFHESYPDEFDSISGGKFILQLKVPYKDWFQHHQPGAYLLAAFILPFAGLSFVKFRVGLAIAFFAINVGLYLLLRKRFPRDGLPWYLAYLAVLAVSATYFWGHMLLADTLAAYFLIPAYAYLVASEVKDRFDIKDFTIVTLLLFFTWFTSMTYTYVVVGLGVYALFRFLASVRRSVAGIINGAKKAVVIAIIPYLLFFGFLGAVGSIKDYYFANVTYNQEFYIYNYPRPPGARFNPIRYAVILTDQFFNNYAPALAGFPSFPLLDPLQVTVALSHAAFFVYILLSRNWRFLFPFFILVVFGSARSNAQALKPTDYQSAVYITSGFLHGLWTLFALSKSLTMNTLDFLQKLFRSTLLVLLAVYWFFTAFFVLLKFEQTFYPKYMGTLPIIYDDPEVAPIINKITTKNDYAWIGPFEFEEVFYLTHAKMPTKYHWFLDHAARSKIKDELIADFQKRKPKVVVFKRTYAPWGGNPYTFNYFLADYLDKYYFRLFTLSSTLADVEYKWKTGNTAHFDLDGDFNFDLLRKDEILKELEEKGLIEQISKKKPKQI